MMPRIIEPGEMDQREGDGWTEKSIVAAETLAASALTAHRLNIEPNASGPERRAQPDREEMFYVIRGDGTAVINGEHHSLAPESLLWLEGGDRVNFEAGDHGLEILHGYAPGLDRP